MGALLFKIIRNLVAVTAELRSKCENLLSLWPCVMAWIAHPQNRLFMLGTLTSSVILNEKHFLISFYETFRSRKNEMFAQTIELIKSGVEMGTEGFWLQPVPSSLLNHLTKFNSLFLAAKRRDIRLTHEK